MKNYYQNQLEFIINALDITLTQVLNRRTGQVYPVSQDAASGQSNLHQILSDAIYRDFYIKGSQLIDNQEVMPKIGYTETQKFIKKLSKANQSHEYLDGGWQVESVDRNGGIYASKGNLKKRTSAGEFLHESFKKGGVQIGDLIKIQSPKEFSQPSNPFYFVIGETPSEENEALQVRIYFHISPEGSEKLVELLSKNFNYYQIPFQFKCLNNTILYNRNDTAVLYLEKNYFNFAWERILDFYDELKPFLQEGEPMFTKPLKHGISFAESPLSSMESFGTSRAKIIAQGIISAISQNSPKTAWLDSILALIQKLNLSMEAFYLNHKANYPYNFQPQI